MIQNLLESHSTLELFFFVAGHLVFGYGVAEMIGMYATTLQIRHQCDMFVRYRDLSGFRHAYRIACFFLLPLYYAMYILSLYFQLYYVLFALGLLISNSFSYIIGNKIYFQGNSVFIWSMWGMGNKFNNIKYYSIQGNTLHILLDNEEHLVVDDAKVDLNQLTEHMERAGAVKLDHIKEGGQSLRERRS